MLKPLEQFFCDTCGMLIKDPADGYLEWLSYEHPIQKRTFNKEFRICHYDDRCRKHALKALKNNDINDEGGHLTDFLGEKGYIQLLDRLDRGSEIDRNYIGVSIEDFREYVLLIKRLTIPHYEEAKQYWEKATNDQFFNDISEYKYFFKETLVELITQYGSDHE